MTVERQKTPKENILTTCVLAHIIFCKKHAEPPTNGVVWISQSPRHAFPHCGLTAHQSHYYRYNSRRPSIQKCQLRSLLTQEILMISIEQLHPERRMGFKNIKCQHSYRYFFSFSLFLDVWYSHSTTDHYYNSASCEGPANTFKIN